MLVHVSLCVFLSVFIVLKLVRVFGRQELNVSLQHFLIFNKMLKC